MESREYSDTLAKFIRSHFGEEERARVSALYVDINRQLASYPGELVVAIERDEDELVRMGHIGSFRIMSNQKRTCIVETYYVGLVRGPALKFGSGSGEGGRLVIPTDTYFTFKGNFRIAPTPCPGDIGSSAFGLLGVDLVSRRSVDATMSMEGPLPAAELFIGDKAVTEWFMKDTGYSSRGEHHEKVFMLWRLCGLLSHPIPLFSAVDRSVKQFKDLLDESRKLREKMSVHRAEIEDVFGKELAELVMAMGSHKK